ncbi:hypothetical protein ACFV4P_35995 [Kitasatospora sp. NPDC059795]|uniref:hypothetical protein n=1 Tax=Kitasatospora sp. NPDC059795 TaxID=3346949 RepID=UPI003653B6C1
MIDTDGDGRFTGHLSWALRLEADVSQRILSYHPTAATVSPERWERIAPLVRSLAVVTAAAYGSGLAMTPLARLAAWCEEQAIPLEPMTVLHPDTVTRFILVGCTGMKSNSRRTAACQLHRASEALFLDRLGQQPPVRLRAKAAPTPPYSPEDIAAWVLWSQRAVREYLTDSAVT